MLRYDRQNKPGFVALYDIRPGNGAGSFLQPWSPHGANNISSNNNNNKMKNDNINNNNINNHNYYYHHHNHHHQQK